MENNTMRDVRVRNGSAILQGCTNCTVYVTNSTGGLVSVEEQEILGIYRQLSIRERMELVQVAISLKDKARKGLK